MRLWLACLSLALSPRLAAAQEAVYLNDAQEAAACFNEATKLFPAAVAARSRLISERGIGAFLLPNDDQDIKAFHGAVVHGFFHLSEALRKDMTKTARETVAPR